MERAQDAPLAHLDDHPMVDEEPIHVTRTVLPEKAVYQRLMDHAWDDRRMTNNGPLVVELENVLRDYLAVPHLALVSNGTLALQIAIRALGLKGKIITTPFSYVATASAILWEGCEPVFADIDPETCCIDPARIESAIVPGVSAIMATHVYGIPCDVAAIEAIARMHGLKVIYDGAHAFGAMYRGRCLSAYGDACTLSLHATKLYHTIEGGAVITHEARHDADVRLLRSFGHIRDEHFALGINAKLSEPHAAMGLALFPEVDGFIKQRSTISAWYDERIADLPLRKPQIPSETTFNFGYYPVFFDSEAERERAIQVMQAACVFPRRYFFPSLDRLPYVRSAEMPVSIKAAATSLCLPLYPGLTQAQVDRVVSALRHTW
ncbi:MAG: DegT/DnrJ/EryC1/StrS family aminotransferase [Flavobacteriales bacterium]